MTTKMMFASCFFPFQSSSVGDGPVASLLSAASPRFTTTSTKTLSGIPKTPTRDADSADFGMGKLHLAVRQESFKRSRSFTSASTPSSPASTAFNSSTCTTPVDFNTLSVGQQQTSSTNVEDDPIMIARPTAPSPSVDEKRKAFASQRTSGSRKRNLNEGPRLHKSPLDEQCEIAGKIVKYLTEDFHGRNTPKKVFAAAKPASIPLLKYTQRLMCFTNKYAEEKDGPDSLGARCAVLAVEYLERADIMLTPDSVHRLFLSAYLVGIKLLYDFYFSNAFWGEVGGLSLKETNAIEIVFCEALNWNFSVQAEVHGKRLESFQQQEAHVVIVS